MNSKSIALAITFATVAIASNAVKVPAVIYPNNFFQVSQIPIVVAFLLFGFKIGVLVGFLNLLGALFLFPLGVAGLIVYTMDFISLFPMFVGLCLGRTLVTRGDEFARFCLMKKHVVWLTIGAIAVRGSLMPLVDYGLVNHILLPLILGFQRSETMIIALIPVFVLYNVIVALYTVPVAYFIAKRVGTYFKTDLSFLSAS